VVPPAGEELAEEAPGGDAEHATVTTRSTSAAITRRIPRPYAVQEWPLLGHPSVLPDRKTHADRELISAPGRYCCRVRTGAILLVPQRVG
jgi:hypothetical protein